MGGAVVQNILLCMHIRANNRCCPHSSQIGQRLQLISSWLLILQGVAIFVATQCYFLEARIEIVHKGRYPVPDKLGIFNPLSIPDLTCTVIIYFAAEDCVHTCTCTTCV